MIVFSFRVLIFAVFSHQANYNYFNTDKLYIWNDSEHVQLLKYSSYITFELKSIIDDNRQIFVEFYCFTKFSIVIIIIQLKYMLQVPPPPTSCQYNSLRFNIPRNSVKSDAVDFRSCILLLFSDYQTFVQCSCKQIAIEHNVQ